MFLEISTGGISVTAIITSLGFSGVFWSDYRTTVPFWGQTSQISSSLSPQRDCGSKGVRWDQAFGVVSIPFVRVVLGSTAPPSHTVHTYVYVGNA